MKNMLEKFWAGIKRHKIVVGIMTVLICVGIAYLILIGTHTSIAFNIENGTVIELEYGKESLPDITATYYKNFFDHEGTLIDVIAENEADMTKIGSSQLKYSAQHKDTKQEIEITMIIKDTIAPEIHLVSNPEYFTSPIAEYQEEGFTAVDNYDGDLTAQVVRTDADGIVTYVVSDSSGNETVVTRTIVYKDVVAPVITLKGSSSESLTVGEKYKEAGCVAVDDCDGDITEDVVVEGSVDTQKAGTYTLVYKVSDVSGNSTQMKRTITIKNKDTVAPVITLKGSSSKSITVGEKYKEDGFIAVDDCDGDITEDVVVEGNVDTQKAGTYTLVYKVSDTSGNSTQMKRTIMVKQPISTPSNEEKTIYLTFDDGPGPYTQRLLDILDQYGVKATFFVTGANPKYYYLIGEAHRRGHTIALHTYSHQYSIYSSLDTYYADLQKIHDIVVEQTGEQPSIVRFPGGTSNNISKKYCEGIMTELSKDLPTKGYQYYDWNVSSEDAGAVKTEQGVIDTLINQISRKKTAVVLQHDIKGFSVEAVDNIIEWGKANGYTFKAMDENTPLIQHKPSN